MVGLKVREIRIIKGMTQNQLAESVGLDPSTLCKIERSKSNPSLSTLTKLAKALGVTIAQLLGEEAKAI
jgi:transcriptional regulator with XRE-family HTH domain